MQEETKLKKDTLILGFTQSPHISITDSRIISDRELLSNTYRWEVDVLRKATVVIEVEPPSRALIYFAIFLVSLQVLDGMLTSVGMARFGLHSEGNPLLKSLMEKTSPDKALVIAKSAAVLLVIILTVVAKRVLWVRDIIGVLSCIYLFAAIIPWVYVLTHYF